MNLFQRSERKRLLRQQKLAEQKLRRAERKDDKRQENQSEEDEKEKSQNERKRQISENEEHIPKKRRIEMMREKQKQAMEDGQRIAIDCSLEKFMSPKVCRNEKGLV